MKPGFEPFLENVTLLGGSKLNAATVSELLTLAPNLVACDGAARAALDLGLTLARVVGDMDSLDAATRARLDPATLHEIPEQDTTDFDKALRSVEAPLILATGFMGRRRDHELAAYASLIRHPGRACILVGETDVVFHAPARLRLRLTPGTRVSLFPLAEVAVALRGLDWSFDRLVLAPWGRLGTSNRAAEPEVEIAPETPGLLVILPRAALPAAIEALRPAG